MEPTRGAGVLLIDETSRVEVGEFGWSREQGDSTEAAVLRWLDLFDMHPRRF